MVHVLSPYQNGAEEVGHDNETYAVWVVAEPNVQSHRILQWERIPAGVH